MIYLALLLILTGLLILFLAIFMESGTGVKIKKTTQTVKETAPYIADPEEIEIMLPGELETGHNGQDDFDDYNDEDLFVDFSGDENGSSSRDLVDEEFSGSFAVYGKDRVDFREDARQYESPPQNISGQGEELSAGEGANAVLFDDRSNIIDYDSGNALVDASIEGYKNIKRVGSGKLKAERDGLSFYHGDSLYRFDFHRIFDVWSGDNFISLPLKGSVAVKLFLLEKGSGLPEKVENYFQEYTKG